jgi:transcriptional regulator with XRE-family HTH domain
VRDKQKYTFHAFWPEQIRAARALLDWSRPRLAEASGVSLRALVKLEAGEISRPRPQTLEAIRAALTQAGIEFLDQGRAGPGVRFREPLSWREGMFGSDQVQ